MVSHQLRQDVQDVIAPDITDVNVKYGTARAHITTAPSAGMPVALRIARQLRARGHHVTGPDTTAPTADLYVQEVSPTISGIADNEDSSEAEVETESSGLLLTQR